MLYIFVDQLGASTHLHIKNLSCKDWTCHSYSFVFFESNHGFKIQGLPYLQKIQNPKWLILRHTLEWTDKLLLKQKKNILIGDITMLTTVTTKDRVSENKYMILLHSFHKLYKLNSNVMFGSSFSNTYIHCITFRWNINASKPLKITWLSTWSKNSLDAWKVYLKVQFAKV